MAKFLAWITWRLLELVLTLSSMEYKKNWNWWKSCAGGKKQQRHHSSCRHDGVLDQTTRVSSYYHQHLVWRHISGALHVQRKRSIQVSHFMHACRLHVGTLNLVPTMLGLLFCALNLNLSLVSIKNGQQFNIFYFFENVRKFSSLFSSFSMMADIVIRITLRSFSSVSLAQHNMASSN